MTFSNLHIHDECLELKKSRSFLTSPVISTDTPEMTNIFLTSRYAILTGGAWVTHQNLMKTDSSAQLSSKHTVVLLRDLWLHRREEDENKSELLWIFQDNIVAIYH